VAAAQRSDAVMVTYHIGYTEERAVLDYCAAHGKGVLIKKAFASGHAGDPAQALQFVFGERAVSSVIVGTINPEHLRQNVAAAHAALVA
jgi:aryl-alcohol dehydrogenase-like predicted oxidoreductase